MSDETTDQTPKDEAGEEEDKPSRVAGALALLLLAGVACLILKAVVTVAPYTAYFVAGILFCLGWQRARSWVAGRRESAGEEDEEAEFPDVAEALMDLGRRGDSVLLTQLRKRLRVADTKAVKALLKDEGIRVRAGVRTPVGNGPGVHHEDIPAPSPVVAGHGEGCCCTSGPTTPTPTTGPEGAGEGLRVVPIGTDGKIVYDLKDTIRHHHVK